MAPAPKPESPSAVPQHVDSEPEKPRHPGRWIGLLVFLIVAGGSAWWYVRASARPAKPAAVFVRTARVKLGSVERTIRLSGVTVASRFSMLLTPQMTGTRSRGTSEFQRILMHIAKSGSTVKKGDVVAEFDRMYMLLRLDDYRSSVVQTAANVRSLNALLDVRNKNYEQTTIRYRGERDKSALEMKKAPVLPAITAENNQLNLRQYTAQLNEIEDEAKFFKISEQSAIRRSEIDLRVSQLEYERAQRNADAMLVKAPIDGLVVAQTIRRGSDVSEIRDGDQLYPGQPYLQLVDTASMAVDASVNQVDVDQIRIGQTARVNFDAYPGLSLPARVISISAMANSRGWRGNWVRDVALRLKLEKTDPRVIPNFTVSADVVLESSKDVPTIPRESLFTDPEDGKTVAFVRGPSGWEKRDVEVGVVTAVSAQVKSGLNDGDIVATEWPVAAAVEPSGNPK
jgi:HlyD family secretion protein